MAHQLEREDRLQADTLRQALHLEFQKSPQDILARNKRQKSILQLVPDHLEVF